MPDLLLELRSEEIPARMQRKAAGDLKKMITDGLVEAGLTYEGAQDYWTPRRLTLDIRGLTARSKDVREEIKGPSTKAPEQAVQGFLRKAGLSDIAEAHVHSDPKKGDFYVAHMTKPGRAAEEVIAELVPAVIRAFPWPKSMRWGSGPDASPIRTRSGGRILTRDGEQVLARQPWLRWVRPLQSILCVFGPEMGDTAIVDFEVDGIRSGDATYGHRFHAPGELKIRRFDDYVAKLEAAKVVLDAERRKSIIRSDAENLAFASGLDLVEDEALLEEVSGLVEWPVVLMGAFEESFLDIPGEVIRLTIRANQKCFVTRPRGEERLANRFLLTANIEASDGGAEIAHGNGKVVRARLSDAVHFWKTDQADLPDLGQLTASAEKFGLNLGKPLDQRMARLDHLNVTFHAKLGTQGERVQRIARLAEELAPVVAASLSSTSPFEGGGGREAAGGGDFGRADHPTPALRADLPGRATGLARPSDPPQGEGKTLAELARRAAVLAKADLQTEIVGEFPELQGVIGRKYALLQGEHPSVAAAIEEHYKPQGPSDRVPTDPVSIAVALADKLDTLVGFWAIDEKPTGSKDPYALRRAALGVVRILVENGVRLSLWDPLHSGGAAIAHGRWAAPVSKKIALELDEEDGSLTEAERAQLEHLRQQDLMADPEGFDVGSTAAALVGLLSFFHDRLKVYLRDKGARHDLIDAVLASASASYLPLEGGGRGPRVLPSASPRTGSAAGGGEPERDDHPTTDLRSDLPGRATGLARPSDPPQGEGKGTGNDDLLVIVRKVEALGAFLATDDGKNLLAGTKRAANILAAEEKKGTAIADHVDKALLRDEAERALFDAVNQAESDASEAIENQDYSAAMRALSVLREPVDSFFERVLVNDEDAAVRANRLALLSRIRAATGRVADFSRIAG